MKYIVLLALTSVLVSCSHTAPRKTVHTAKSHLRWYSMGHKKVDKRRPASLGDLKALETALRSNDGWKNDPVGQEVVKLTVTNANGEEYSSTETAVYLTGSKYGSVSLVTYSGDGVSSLVANEQADDVAAIIEDLQTEGSIKSIKKISNTEFVMTLETKTEDYYSLCDLKLDVTKSSALFTSSCQDGQGTTSVTTLKSVTKVDLKKYEDQLKSIKMEVTPLVLQNYDEAGSIVDEEARDWSFLLK